MGTGEDGLAGAAPPPELEPGRMASTFSTPDCARPGQAQLERRGPDKQPPLSTASPWEKSLFVLQAQSVLTPGGEPHLLPGRGWPLILNGQGLQTLFLIP